MGTRTLSCALLFWGLGITGALAGTITVPGDYPTIQAAIDAAPAGAVIQLQPGHYHEHLKLYSITRTLTLRGDPSNPSTVIIDGDGASDAVLRVVDSGSTLVVEGVTITGGRGLSGNGGGLFMANSQAVFRDCAFIGNAADMGGAAFILTSGGLFERCVFRSNTSNKIGGAVLMHDGSSTAFSACQFLDNQAGLGDPQSAYGGGLVVNDSSATFVGCAILGNRSRYAAGGIAVTASFDRPSALITMRDTTISNNVAERADPSLPPAEGGGMHIEDNVHAVLERCQIRGNVAHRGGGLNAYRAHYTVIDSMIEDNQANVIAGSGGTGGGIFAASVNTAQPTRRPAVVELTRTVVRRNTADVGGGIFIGGDFGGLTSNHASLTVTDSLVARNTATSRGGGIDADRTDSSIVRTMIVLNVVAPPQGSYGGGILSAAGSNLTISNSTIAGNEAADQGGGVYADQGGRLDIADSELFANLAHSSGGVGGGALAIGQAAGPVVGPIGGSVTRTVIADNGPNYQVYEADCDLPHWSAITYTGNTIHSATAETYFRSCNGASASVAAFNALTGKASGNVDAPASFARFAAVPGTIAAGRSSVLAWCVPGAMTLSLDGGGGAVNGETNSADVTPDATTTYTLLLGPAPLGTATVTLTCAGLGTPFLRSPANGASSGDATSATLQWWEAPGATSYDVYLDTSDDPTTLVAQDVTATSITVPGLQTGSSYGWKVVAKSLQCATPTESPLFTFRADAVPSACSFDDRFDSGSADGWERRGAGSIHVIDGRLRLTGARLLTVTPPAPAMGEGSFSVSLLFEGRLRGQARLLFAYRAKRTYRELLVQNTGRLRLAERTGSARRVVARTRRPLTTGAPIALRIDVASDATTVLLDGTEVLRGSFRGPAEGVFAIRAVGSTIEIDDVCIASPAASGGLIVPVR